jgi:hypothetical protein
MMLLPAVFFVSRTFEDLRGSLCNLLVLVGAKFEELVCFTAAHSQLDAELIEVYRKRQPTISEHQQTIAGYPVICLSGYLRLRPSMMAQANTAETDLTRIRASNGV